jgi:hypothetical protein
MSEFHVQLTAAQNDAIRELGSRGSGGSFDPLIMSQLLSLGMIEVRIDDRRVVLTNRGRTIYNILVDQ